MKQHTQKLWQLAAELFIENEQIELHRLTSSYPFDASQLKAFDNSLPGPSMVRMNCQNSGRYEIADRDVFRPLQYCGSYFEKCAKRGWEDEIQWHTRHIVQISSAHIENLIKNIGNVFHLLLGAELRNAIVKARVDKVTWQQIDTYTHIYNDTKHNFGQDKDTHMFSAEDAILAYFVCRKLGTKLYPLANLFTD